MIRKRNTLGALLCFSALLMQLAVSMDVAMIDEDERSLQQIQRDKRKAAAKRIIEEKEAAATDAGCLKSLGDGCITFGCVLVDCVSQPVVACADKCGPACTKGCSTVVGCVSGSCTGCAKIVGGCACGVWRKIPKPAECMACAQHWGATAAGCVVFVGRDCAFNGCLKPCCWEGLWVGCLEPAVSGCATKCGQCAACCVNLDWVEPTVKCVTDTAGACSKCVKGTCSCAAENCGKCVTGTCSCASKCAEGTFAQATKCVNGCATCTPQCVRKTGDCITEAAGNCGSCGCATIACFAATGRYLGESCVSCGASTLACIQTSWIEAKAGCYACGGRTITCIDETGRCCGTQCVKCLNGTAVCLDGTWRCCGTNCVACGKGTLKCMGDTTEWCCTNCTNCSTSCINGTIQCVRNCGTGCVRLSGECIQGTIACGSACASGCVRKAGECAAATMACGGRCFACSTACAQGTLQCGKDTCTGCMRMGGECASGCLRCGSACVESTGRCVGAQCNKMYQGGAACVAVVRTFRAPTAEEWAACSAAIGSAGCCVVQGISCYQCWPNQETCHACWAAAGANCAACASESVRQIGVAASGCKTCCGQGCVNCLAAMISCGSGCASCSVRCAQNTAAKAAAIACGCVACCEQLRQKCVTCTPLCIEGCGRWTDQCLRGTCTLGGQCVRATCAAGTTCVNNIATGCTGCATDCNTCTRQLAWDCQQCCVNDCVPNCQQCARSALDGCMAMGVSIGSLAQGCATCTPVCLQKTLDLAIAAAAGCASCSTSCATGCIGGCGNCMTSCSTQCSACLTGCSAQCLAGCQQCSAQCSGCVDDMAQRGAAAFTSCAEGCSGVFGTILPARISQVATRTRVSFGTTFRMRWRHTYNVAIPRNIAWAKTIASTRRFKMSAQKTSIMANIAKKSAASGDAKDLAIDTWHAALDAKWAAEDARLALWRSTPAASIVMEGRNVIVDREKKEERYRVEDAFCKEMDRQWFQKWQDSYPGMESYRATVLRRLVDQDKAVAPRGTEDPMYKLGAEPLAPIDEAVKWTCGHCGKNDNSVQYNPLFCGSQECGRDRREVVPERTDERSINERAGLGYETNDAKQMWATYLKLKKQFQGLREAKRYANEEAKPPAPTDVRSVTNRYNRQGNAY